MAVRRKLVIETVEDVLSSHGIKHAPVPVRKIAENLNIEIVLDEVDDDLSGFLLREKDTDRVVIGANGRHPLSRQRFTIAHELGHFLLHAGEVVHLDEEAASFTLDFRDGRSSKGEDDNEKEANLFAAELLMPAAFLKEDLAGMRVDLLSDGSGLSELATKYEVSLQALTFRLANLRYINL